MEKVMQSYAKATCWLFGLKFFLKLTKVTSQYTKVIMHFGPGFAKGQLHEQLPI
jgi:hypothetical protein